MGVDAYAEMKLNSSVEFHSSFLALGNRFHPHGTQLLSFILNATLACIVITFAYVACHLMRMKLI